MALQPPDSMPAWFADDSSYDGVGAKNVLVVQFHAGTSAPVRAQALAAVRGVVVGGDPLQGQEGFYFVQVPASGDPRRRGVLAEMLRRQPGVNAVDYLPPPPKPMAAT